MADTGNAERTGLFGLVHRIVEIWALLGGVMLILLTLVNVWSVFSDVAFNAPLLGDVELVELGVAMAAFSFLPYCQLHDANVTADIFTAGASRFWVSVFALIAAVVALGFSLLLLWRMWLGMGDYMTYEETTATLQIPIWVAFPPILFSLALLAVSAAVSLVDSLRGFRRR